MNKKQNNPSEWEIIDTYTRAQAIADGFQVECPNAIRKEAGIKHPVFFTSTLWEQYINPPNGTDGWGQSLDGRLWDTLFMFVFAVKTGKFEGNACNYQVIYLMPGKTPEDEPVHKEITLYAVIGPTDIDQPQPAITIMLPGED